MINVRNELFKRCIRLGIGHNKAIYNLRNYGVDTEIIDTCLEELDDDEEYQAAMLLINNYYQRNSTISYRNIQRKIKEKLFLKGFTNDVIDKAMAEYDFEYDLEKEKEDWSIELAGEWYEQNGCFLGK